MEKLLEQLLRRGVIPLCCGGAAGCFALYQVQVTHGADVWAAQIRKTDNEQELALLQNYVLQLRKHAGASLNLSLISASITWEAYRDWQSYAAEPSLDEMAVQLWQRQKPIPFVARGPVLVTTLLSLTATYHMYGGWKLWQPIPPVHFAR